MKKLIVFLGLIVITAQLAACGEQKKASVATRVGQGGGRGIQNKGQTGPNAAVPSTAAQASYSQIWGVVTPQQGTINENGQSYPNQNANDVSRLFLSTDWAWALVGATTTQADPNYDSSIYGPAKSCSGQNCIAGITLGSDNGSTHTPLTFANGKKLSDNISGARVGIVGSGITLVFWDSLTGTMSPDGEMLNPIPVFIGLDPNNSFIQGSNVTLSFADSKGSIVLQGAISGQNFQGNSMQFNNTVLHTGGSTDLRGNLGTFNINACAAFTCN